MIRQGGSHDLVMQAEGLPHDLQAGSNWSHCSKMRLPDDLQAASNSFSLQQDLPMLQQQWGCMAPQTTPNCTDSCCKAQGLPAPLLQGTGGALVASVHSSTHPHVLLRGLTREFHSHSSVLPSTSDSTNVTGLPSSGGPRFFARDRRNIGSEMRIHTAAMLANATSTPTTTMTMAMGVSRGGMALHLQVSSRQGLQGV